VECGVNRGGFARMTIEYRSRRLQSEVLDAFKGFSEAYLACAPRALVSEHPGAECQVKKGMQLFKRLSRRSTMRD
jgi:hypothetical protein